MLDKMMTCPPLLQSNAKNFKQHLIKINEIYPCKPLRTTNASTLNEHLFRLNNPLYNVYKIRKDYNNNFWDTIMKLFKYYF